MLASDGGPILPLPLSDGLSKITPDGSPVRGKGVRICLLPRRTVVVLIEGVSQVNNARYAFDE